MRTAGPRAAASCLHARLLGVVAGCAALACVLTLSASGSATAATSASDSTFINASDTAFSTFNPFLSIQQGEIDTLQEIYPTLTFDNEHNEPGPYLATSWKVAPNHLSWTFHIRTGLKWSDGKPLTASDVAWTYNLIMHNDTAATANGSLVANFKSVTAPNASTVVITTTKPQANMLNLVTSPGIPIVPEHIWKSHVKNLGSFTNTKFPVVGYGPYTFTSYKAPTTVTMTASKSFFWGVPKYHRLVIQYFANSSAQDAALRNGAVNSSYQLTNTEWRALRNVSGLKSYRTITNDWTGVEINGNARTRSGQHIGTGNPLLANPSVRRAIALGINRAEIVQKVTGGAAVETGSYLTKAYPEWYWTPSASEAQNYSPAKANALLDQAGFPKGKDGYRRDPKTGKELSFRLGIHSDSPDDAATANYLVGFMKAIGIKLKVQSQSYTQLNDNLAIGDWDLLMDQWPENADPTYLLSIQTCGVLPTDKHGGGGNTDAFFCNHRYDKLYAAEQQEFDHAKRVADVKAMEKILYDADYDVILYDTAYNWATYDKYTKGFLYGSPDSNGLYPLQNYELGWIKATPAASVSGGGGGGGSSTVLIIVIVVVVVLLAGGGAAVMRRRRQTAEERE